MALSALRQSVDYFAINNTLLISLAFVVASVVRGARLRKQTRGLESDLAERPKEAPGAGFRADVTLLIWFAVSYAGLAVGGRFFGHYFFQTLPALCLIGARGFLGIVDWLKPRTRRSSSPALRRATIALLALGFAVTLARYHTRTIALAADWLRGEKSASTRQWFHETLNSEERAVAAFIRDLPAGAADEVGPEAMRAGVANDGTEAGGPAGYLFVWGYRPEIYFWSGLRPASKFLSSQPLTGVPADVHYFGDDYQSLLDETTTARARAQLLADLERTRPEFIVDELASFNTRLSMMSFPELAAFLGNYRELGTTGRFVIYRNKQFIKRRRERLESGKQ
jgi:hypothetical protein